MGKTLVETPFAGGIDEKTAKEYLDPSKQTQVVNGNFVRSGTIEKRLGIGHLPNTVSAGNPVTTAITSSQRMTSWSRSSATTIAGGNLYNYSPSSQKWGGVSPVTPVRAWRRPFLAAGSGFPPYLADVPLNGRTVRVAAWTDPLARIQVSAFDADSGDVLLQPTVIFTGSSSAIPTMAGVYYLPNAPAGRQVAILYADNASTPPATPHLWGVSLDLTANTFSTPVALLTGPQGTIINFDIVPFVGDPSGGLVAVYVTGTTSISYAYFHPDFTEQSYGQIEAVTGPTAFFQPCVCYATYGTGEALWIGYTYGTSGGTHYLRAAALKGDGTFASLVAPLTVFTSSSYINPSGIVRASTVSCSLVFWLGDTITNGMNTVLSYVATVSTFGGGRSAYLALPYGMLPVARPFVQNYQVFQPAVYEPYLALGDAPSTPRSYQNTLYLLQVNIYGPANDLARVVATIAPRQIAPASIGIETVYTGVKVPFCSTINGSRLAMAIETIGIDVSGVGGDSGFTPMWIADFSFDTSLAYQFDELGDGLHITGGIPMISDGVSVCESSFFHYPEFMYATLSGTSGTFSGTYQYAVCYAIIDAAGNVTRSAPCQIQVPSSSYSGGKLVTLNIPTLSTTWRDIESPGLVIAEIYRSQSNGGVLTFVDSIDVSNVAGPYMTWGPDTNSDASIGSASYLYTTGGTLDNVNPPSAQCSVVHKNRLWIIDDTFRTVWFTKAFVQGETAGWNEALQFDLTEPGDGTALASMDDKLVVFSANAICVVYGDGPDATGQGSDLTVPQKVVSDVGALDWRSVVSIPQGVMFRSSPGIYLLDRSLAVTYIGKAVADTLASYPNITGSCLVAAQNQARFIANNGTSSVAIVYDYVENAWSVHHYDQLSGLAHSPVIVNGQYSLATADGQFWQEHLSTDASAYFDADVTGTNHFVITTVSGAWVRNGAVQGLVRLGRLQFLGERLDDCGVSLSLARDYNPAVVQTSTWTSSSFVSTDPIARVSMYADARYNLIESANLTISDSPGTNVTNGRGMRFVSAGYEIETVGTRFLLPARLSQ